jgi:hypothetical protein
MRRRRRCEGLGSAREYEYKVVRYCRECY